MPSKGFTNDAIPALSACESPIEGKFVQAWFDLMREQGRNAQYFPDEHCKCRVEFPFLRTHEGDGRGSLPERFGVRLQANYDHYRIDSIITAYGWSGGYAALAVELDGKSFHATFEQQENDRKKDRALASGAITCVRYSGPEVYRSAASVVSEVALILVGLMNRNETIQSECWRIGYEKGLSIAPSNPGRCASRASL